MMTTNSSSQDIVFLEPMPRPSAYFLNLSSQDMRALPPIKFTQRSDLCLVFPLLKIRPHE